MTYLISMQTAHATLDFCGVHLLDAGSERCLDEHTAEQTDHAGCVQQSVAVSGWHEIFNASSEMISPGSVLM